MQLEDIAFKLKMPTRESTKPKEQSSILEDVDGMV